MGALRWWKGCTEVAVRLPILRFGASYESLDTQTVVDARSGEPVGVAGLANAGLIRRDARKIATARASLARFTVAELVAMCGEAAAHFMRGELPMGDTVLGPEGFVDVLSRTTGLPHTLCRANMAKIERVLSGMSAILAGLTRGIDLSVLDRGHGTDRGITVSWVPSARSLAAVLPSNSPGVHSLWLPAIALKCPVALKPGSSEPWTPLRIIEALCAAGVPREAFGYYPTDHEGGAALVDAHDRALVFGDATVAARFAGRADVEVHGPGHAKVVLGPDVDWREHVELLATSVALNGGRSCINASTIVVPADSAAIAEALAERLAAQAPAALDDPDATLAGFASAGMADAIDARIDAALPGARDVSAAVRGGPRRVDVDGLAFLLPTVVTCAPDHPLANREYPFPFVAVVELPADQMVSWMGPSLVVAAVTEHPALVADLLAAPHIDRLHLGPIGTTAIHWDQPHEGNLFEWLYRRRAFASVPL